MPAYWHPIGVCETCGVWQRAPFINISPEGKVISDGAHWKPCLACGEAVRFLNGVQTLVGDTIQVLARSPKEFGALLDLIRSHKALAPTATPTDRAVAALEAVKAAPALEPLLDRLTSRVGKRAALIGLASLLWTIGKDVTAGAFNLYDRLHQTMTAPPPPIPPPTPATQRIQDAIDKAMKDQPWQKKGRGH